MRRWIFFAVKLAVSGGLLYWAFRSVDLAAVGRHIARVDPAWIAAALAALGIQLALAGQRWAWIAAGIGVPLSPARAIRYSAVGIFFNQALPSTVGGDAMRAWLFGRIDRHWKPAIYSVIVDRIAGVGFLAIVVAACLPWSLALITAAEGRAAVLVIGIGGVAALAVCLMLGFVAPDAPLAALRPLRPLFEIAIAARKSLLGRERALRIALFSILIHALTALAAWCLARAIGIHPDMLSMLILILPVVLISMIPISIGGWGIREGVMVVALGYAGIEPSQALAVSVLLGGASLVFGIVGGIVWIAERKPTLAAATPSRHG